MLAKALKPSTMVDNILDSVGFVVRNSGVIDRPHYMDAILRQLRTQPGALRGPRDLTACVGWRRGAVAACLPAGASWAVPEKSPFTLSRVVAAGDPDELGAYLQQHTGLSRGALKDALAKGALRIRRAGGHTFLRMRKADAHLDPGDRIELGYDHELLSRVPPQAELLVDLGAYSGWYKPAGLLAQGNAFGDHCSALRQVEIWARRSGRQTYLVQRLDRESYGVMMFAHNRKAAAELSRLMGTTGADKVYRAVVHGRLEGRCGPTGSFDASLDGRAAITRYEILSYDPAVVRTTVSVTLQGGRLHQIRRHFAAAGFPLIGDPRYGRGDGEPLRLAATRLAFVSGLLGRAVEVILPPEKVGF